MTTDYQIHKWLGRTNVHYTKYVIQCGKTRIFVTFGGVLFKEVTDTFDEQSPIDLPERLWKRIV